MEGGKKKKKLRIEERKTLLKDFGVRVVVVVFFYVVVAAAVDVDVVLRIRFNLVQDGLPTLGSSAVDLNFRSISGR